MNNETDAFISKFLTELREDNAALFIGAGLSKNAGFVDWIELLSPIANQLGLDARRETDLVGIAQYHVNANATNRHELNQLLIDKFSDLGSPTKNHEILARLPIRTYWTTNYDRLIERAIEDGGKRVDAKYTNEQLATTRRGRDAIVYKMHGDIETPDKAILTKDDYERYHQTHGPFITALAGDLVERTFLFLGFSFSDPNLDYVLGRIRTRFTANQRKHYCITKHRTKIPNESEEDFQYAKTKQELMTQDLLRFNIKTIFVDEYSHITRILKTIEDRFRRRTIFISGSAVDYGDWGQSSTEEFVAKLSRELIEKDFRITSGFGLGIGGAVVTGAVQQIYSTKRRSIDEQLVLRPFPIGIQDENDRKQTYQRYRDELIAQAGIAIFLMGNKTVNGVTVNADGVKAEFETAKQKGLYVLPIGASGTMAEMLHKEVMDNFDSFFPNGLGSIRQLIDQLGKPTKNPNDLLDPLLDLVNFLSKE
jgi:Sir2- and TIR-associating SLOG family/SIR2-like domain